MPPPIALAATFDAVARAAAMLEEPWWIIGSAAAALLGTDEQPADVDILAGGEDAGRLAQALGAEAVDVGSSEIFRSAFLARGRTTLLPVEIMTGLSVRSPGGWMAVQPVTRVAVRGLYVPSAAEQARICRLFGRPKDIARARRLDRLAAT